MRIAPLTRLVLAFAAWVAPLSAQQSFQRQIGDGQASILIHAEHQPTAEAAAGVAFGALEAFGESGVGAACDQAVEAARSAGASAVAIGWRGITVVGDAPPGAPGWLVPIGFGTPGYPVLRLPLANTAVGRASVDGEPLKVTVIAPSAKEASHLAQEARRRGRRDGRLFVAQNAGEGVRFFLEDARFRPLFDGRSLDGWTTTGGRYDGQAVWEVARGVIVGRTGANGAGGLLYTDEEFTSYVVEMEVDVEEPFDSGIFVHMVPRERDLKGAQVTLDNRPGGEVGAIYADGFLAHNEEAKGRYRQGEWNHFEVRVTGFDMRVEAWMNGEKISDHQLPPDATGFASAGRIGVQVHGGDAPDRRARFRNVRIRELPVFALAGEADGWEALFSEPELAGWERHGACEDFSIQDGVVSFPPGDGHIATKEDFRDFRLRMDFKTARMANSGVFLRSARDGTNPSFSGCEIQILDDFNWEAVTGSTLKPWQLTGSLYGAIEAGAKRLHPLGEWNTYEVLYRGSRLAVALNGRLLYDVDTHAIEPVSGAPFADRVPEGFLGLQAHSPAKEDGEPSLWFRHVRVQRL